MELTVGHVGRDGEGALLVEAHADEALVPALDDLTDADCAEWLLIRNIRRYATYV